jgi:arylsulfatase A-like enzyme
MKLLTTIISFLCVLSIVSCSQLAVKQRIGDSNAIPYPLEEWKGVQGKPWRTRNPILSASPKRLKDAPNVLIIMLDDAGYSNATSFGGVMKTPTFDRIGDEGIRYTHMSVAAVCSPTRGSLLTGYNIHQIGTGIISEFATGYPGYNSQIDYTTPSIAKILTDNGYATAAFGKWHNTPMEEASPAGPFESWPTGIWGFEYFWGFLGGETNQFHPLLYENTTAIDTPKTNADGSEFHLSQGMADQAIKWLDNWKGLRDVPFFMYYTPGAVHAPIQVPKEWRDKYKGQFDDGWHAYRAQQLERQKKLGLVPEDAKMVDWPEVHAQMGFLQRRGKGLSVTANGGQCRLSGTCGLSHRTGH